MFVHSCIIPILRNGLLFFSLVFFIVLYKSDENLIEGKVFVSNSSTLGLLENVVRIILLGENVRLCGAFYFEFDWLELKRVFLAFDRSRNIFKSSR